MGSETSSEPEKTGGKDITKPVEHDHEDIYILEDLANFSLKNKIKEPYFLVDPQIINGENQYYENFERKSIQVEGCSSVNELFRKMEELNSDLKIKVICAAWLKDEDYQRLNENNKISGVYLFCQNQERAELLMNNFSKIKSAKFDITQLNNYFLQEEQSDQNLEASRTNLLIMTEDDTNLMNKYRIIFHSLTQGNSKVQAKTDFVNFSKKFYPESLNEIDEFDKTYQIDLTGKEALTQTTQWLIKPGFFWESTQTLPKMTADPKKLAYLRFAFKESYEAIYKLHKSEPTYNFAEAYMLITPTEEELIKLRENMDNFLIFTTFIKAYTNEKYVKQALKKNNKSFAVTIVLKTRPSINEKLDFGYKICSDVPPGAPNVILNIYNVFCIKEFDEDYREIVLEYGSLAVVSKSTKYKKILNDKEKNLLRNYDYLEDIISRISSQAQILQMSGYFQDSLKICLPKLEIIRKSQPSEETLDKHKIELGDAYKINEEFAKAEEQFLSIKEGKMLLISYVHLAELYFKTKETEKLSKIIALIDKNLGKYKDISSPDFFKAQNYIGMEMINQGRFKEACKLYKSLRGEVNEFYECKFEGIPLVYEINRNMAVALMKEKNYDEALNLLDNTKNWQKICEGNKSPGLIMTENLIMSVHLSQGEEKKNEAEVSAKEIKKIKKAVTLEDNIYMSRSAVIINLNEIAINIQTTSTSTGVPALKVGPSEPS